MRQTRYWTEEEVNILKENYVTKGPKILAEMLGRTENSTQRKASNLGIHTDGVTAAMGSQLCKLHDITRKRMRANMLPREEINRRRRVRSYKYCVERRIWKLQHGVCLRCNDKALPNAKYCLYHWASIIGVCCGHHDVKFGVKLLEKFENQKRRCAISGEELIPGLNASIDHIVPKCKGGSLDSLDNLHWVTQSVNFAKRQFLTEEFIDFCRKVVKFNDNS